MDKWKFLFMLFFWLTFPLKIRGKLKNYFATLQYIIENTSVLDSSYTEVQKFNQWWLWIILIGLVSLPTYGLVQQLFLGKPFGSQPISDAGLLVFFGTMWFLFGFFRYLELRTEIDASGIRAHLRPLNSENFTWDQIEHLELIRYGFVGYGFRFSAKYGTVYNTSGNKGLCIVLKSGSRYVIGTQNPEGIKKTLKVLKKQYNTIPF